MEQIHQQLAEQQVNKEFATEICTRFALEYELENRLKKGEHLQAIYQEFCTYPDAQAYVQTMFSKKTFINTNVQ
ncbi:MAG: hypothetical protein ACMXYF_03890 [Candidatus Woesearchaeota archaeon]